MRPVLIVEELPDQFILNPRVTEVKSGAYLGEALQSESICRFFSAVRSSLCIYRLILANQCM